MADKIRLLMESMLPDMLFYLKKGIFDKEEIRSAMKHREQHEYNLMRKNQGLKDLLNAIQFEYDLERERRKRFNKLTIKKQSERDFQIIKRIIQLWDKATQRHRYDIELWKQYLSFCYYIKSKKQFFKVITSALRFNSQTPELWLIAANFESEFNRNPFKARKIYYKALKVMGKNQRLWEEFFKSEVQFLLKLKERAQILSGNKMEEERKTDQGDENIDQFDNIVGSEKVQVKEDENMKLDFIGFETEGTQNMEALENNLDSTEINIEVFIKIYELSCEQLNQVDISLAFLQILDLFQLKELEPIHTHIKNKLQQYLSNESNSEKKMEILLTLKNLNVVEKITSLDKLQNQILELLSEYCSSLNDNDQVTLLQYLRKNKALIENICQGDKTCLWSQMSLLQSKLGDIITQILKNIDIVKGNANQSENLLALIEFIDQYRNFASKEVIALIDTKCSSEIIKSQQNHIDIFIAFTNINEPKKAVKQMHDILNIGNKFNKADRLNILLQILKIYENQQNSDQAQLFKLLNLSIQNLLNFKIEFEIFLTKYFNYVKQCKLDDSFTGKVCDKLVTYNQNCPLSVYIIIIKQTSVNDKKSLAKTSFLFKKIQNWFKGSIVFWKEYFSFQKIENAAQCPILLEEAAKKSGIAYQELSQIYTQIINNDSGLEEE